VNTEASGSHGGDLELATACARGEPGALATFEATYVPVIAATARRFGSGDFVSEVSQVVRRRLLVAESGAPRIAEYRGQGSLSSFVQAVTVRLALNALQSSARAPPMKSDDLLLELPGGGDDPELAAIKQRSRADFKEAFAGAMASLDDVSRNALRLHYLDGLTLAEIGGLHGWSVPTASRRLAAARVSLLESTRRLMGERLKLSPQELDSVLRLIESRLSIDSLVG
jgi:RNA polymerase sigma-70 factor, ECF subfamily